MLHILYIRYTNNYTVYIYIYPWISKHLQKKETEPGLHCQEDGNGITYLSEISGRSTATSRSVSLRKVTKMWLENVHMNRHVASIWVFPKIGVPQNGWFIMENPIKMEDFLKGILFAQDFLLQPFRRLTINSKDLLPRFFAIETLEWDPLPFHWWDLAATAAFQLQLSVHYHLRRHRLDACKWKSG